MKRGLGLVLLILSILSAALPISGRRNGGHFHFGVSRREGFFQRPFSPDGMVRINDAEMEELVLLPGIGETLAAEILQEKRNNGPFSYPEDLLSVRGIGVKKLKEILPWLDFGGGE
jgi:competence ComEA-like helix-hairpin-helix protein